MVVDTHAHLNNERLAPLAKEICKDMQKNGLRAIINVGFDYKSSVLALEQAQEFEGVWAALGIHPHDAKDSTQQQLQEIKKLAKHKRVLAIGECGLDYYYDLSPREIQREVFLHQLRLASEVKLPVIIHCRDAYADMQQLLEQNANLLKNGAVMHCYSGSLQMSKAFLDLGLYLSFGGVLTFKNAIKAREVLLYAPKDRVLLETDCPYLTPEPHRGEINLPQYVNFVAERAAQIWGIDVQSAHNITTHNAEEFFKSEL